MRIDDQVRTNTFLGERHVFLPVGHSDGTFLAVTRGKFVTDLRNANRSHFDLGEAIAIFVCRQDDLVYHALLGMLELGRAVFPRL